MKKLVFNLFFISLFLATPALSYSYCKNAEKLSQKAVIAIKKAKELEKKNEIDNCIKVLDNFIKRNKDKDHHYVEYYLGTLYLEKNNNAKALKAFEKSTELCDGFCPAWQNIGKISFDLKNYKKAATSLEKAYYLSKKRDKNILFAAAMAYKHDDNTEKAFQLLDIITSDKYCRSHLTAYTHFGISLKKQKQVLKRLDKILEHEKQPYILKLAANTALSTHDYKKAVNFLTIYSMAQDTSFKEDKLTADLYRSLNAPFKAAEFYEKAISKKEDKKVLKSYVSSLIESAQFTKAIKNVENYLKKYPEDCEFWKLKGVVYYEKDDFENAYNAILRSFELKNKDKNSAVLLAYCAAKSGKIDHARKLITQNSNFKESRKNALEILNSYCR
eukprot:gnl/Chilomastix_cuspidata/8761.p2 GENE.gnl/Chilomastix_cuspidata/8761~~gnl/Chilomastix_cuspidata/8761.p2  ORF type:complete len:387 (-),score=49.40 gnl/Chilomastix_cuspidata/8761:954-2114(-)